MTGATESVVVIGAGAVGATVAADLADRAEVTLLERGSVAAGSTGRAAGVCYDAFAEDVDAAIADRSVERFRTLATESSAFDFRECPYVWLAREGDERRADAIRTAAERMRVNGRDVAVLDPDDLADRFPVVRAEDVAVAAVATDAGHCTPGDYARAMVERCRRAGGTVREETPARVETDPRRVVAGGRTYRPDAVLVAAGAHSGQVLADAGVQVAVKPYRVQALTAELDGRDATATAGSDDPRRYDAPMVYDATGGFYCRPHETGLLAGDGTETVEADPDVYDRDANPGFAADLGARVADRLDVDPTVCRSWAGLCTATPDRDPLVGAVDPGIYVATGFQGHGFMRSPGIGERLSTAIADGDPTPIEPFDPCRFDGTEDFEIREGMVIEGDDERR